MWRKVVTMLLVVEPMRPAVEPMLRAPDPQQELTLLLLPQVRRTRSLPSLLSFWAPTSPGSTTRAASFFQHVSATTWLRAL
jgi:hypothetical protein